MPVLPDALTQAWVQSLLDNSIRESTQLEYKSALPGKSSGEKKSFLKEVTAFANTVGGVVLYGVMEKQDEGKNTGIPEAAPGVGARNKDEVESRMNSLIKDAVEPRIEGVRYVWIPYDGEELLAVWVPASWQAPHMMILEGSRRFYGRSSTSSYPLSVTEIRNIVLGRNEAPTRIRAFHLERVNKVRSGDTPVPLRERAYFVMHVVPINEFMSGSPIDLNDLIPPRSESAYASRWNLDGRVSWSTHGQQGEGPQIDYCQVFRNGSLELVETWWLGERSPGKPVISRNELRTAFESSLHFAQELARRGATYPMMLMVSLIGVKGYEIETRGPHFEWDKPKLMDRNDVMLPDRILRGNEGDAKVIGELIGIGWQAAGWESERPR